MGLGPLRLMDEIGLDTTLQAGLVLADAFPERIVRSGLIVSTDQGRPAGEEGGTGILRLPAGRRHGECGPGRGGPRNHRALDRPHRSGSRPSTVPRPAPPAADRQAGRGCGRKRVAAAVASRIADAVGGRANPRRRESCRSARHRTGRAVGARISGRQRGLAVLGRLAGGGLRGAAASAWIAVSNATSRPRRRCRRGPPAGGVSMGNTGKRGQAPFAGTARRVLRTNGACPLFPPCMVIYGWRANCRISSKAAASSGCSESLVRPFLTAFSNVVLACSAC